MTDIFTKEKRSEVMSRIRPKDTKPELIVFRYLRQEGIYFQKHYRKVSGSPDVALPRKRLAVFVDGDFWHGYRFSSWKEKLPAEYWQNKIETNIRRDARNFRRLRKDGWKVLRVWEHDLVPKKREKTLLRVREFLTSDH